LERDFRTPLVDFFRRGEVSSDVRTLAAKGVIAPRASEQLALLVLLADDPDPDIRTTALNTISRIPEEALSAFLAGSDVPQDIRHFFASRGITPGANTAVEVGEPLVSEPDGEESEPEPAVGTLQRLSRMTVAERLKTAVLGSREERALLVRDSAKLVAVAVLSSPRVTDSEVESFARMTNVCEDVLRAIATGRQWLKNYGTVSALVRNPKTPVGISLSLVPRLSERDVKSLSLDRNVPEAVRSLARRKLAAGQQRR
jgi:hypothetical protein